MSQVPTGGFHSHKQTHAQTLKRHVIFGGQFSMVEGYDKQGYLWDARGCSDCFPKPHDVLITSLSYLQQQWQEVPKSIFESELEVKNSHSRRPRSVLPHLKDSTREQTSSATKSLVATTMQNFENFKKFTPSANKKRTRHVMLPPDQKIQLSEQNVQRETTATSKENLLGSAVFAVCCKQSVSQ